ncbi:MAG: dihydroorotase, partial [Pseudomonadota bacterium]
MTVLNLVNARLVDPEAGTVTIGGLRLEGGKITTVLDKAARPEGPITDCGLKFLAPGIVDVGVKVCEPGERHKESYRSAGLAAAA